MTWSIGRNKQVKLYTQNQMSHVTEHKISNNRLFIKI